MIPKALVSLVAADLQDLHANAVPESRHLDYKLTLPGRDDDAKREFLADVSSLANAGGGDLVFGIAESKGVPTAIEGVEVADPDAERLRLLSVIRDGVDPRIVGVDVAVVPGFPKGAVWVLRVPRSFNAPHMVTFKNSSRFFSRTSGGKYQLDVREIREAFVGAELATERVRRFRADRLAAIAGSNTPVRMLDDPPATLVAHVLPLAPTRIDRAFVDPLERTLTLALHPMGAGGWNPRHNLDGFLTYVPGEKGSQSYVQLFRSGAIESVSQRFFHKAAGQPLTLSPIMIERELGERLDSQFSLLAQLDVRPPFVVTVAMLHVRGAVAVVGDWRWERQVAPLDRDFIDLPDVAVEEAKPDLDKVLRPMIDALWNACGFAQSPFSQVSGR